MKGSSGLEEIAEMFWRATVRGVLFGSLAFAVYLAVVFAVLFLQ